MCGIFGVIGPKINRSEISILISHSRQRGKDSSGLVLQNTNSLKILRSDSDIKKIKSAIDYKSLDLILGHSRLVTNGYQNNQPITSTDVVLLHNGIVVNEAEIWPSLSIKKELEIDSETILAIAQEHINLDLPLESLSEAIFEKCKGIVSAVLFFPKLGKLLLLSNNGSLFVGKLNNKFYFASEEFPLSKIGCLDILQLRNQGIIHKAPVVKGNIKISDKKARSKNLVPGLSLNKGAADLLKYYTPDFQRCVKCILPETMPFIKFDQDGICNFCKNYVLRNQPRSVKELNELVSPYRKLIGADCIVPFSGGRDSSYALHLIVNELNMKPITYTYDWAMVTDLARRNISRMCSELKVENIIIADDIEKKRKYIAKNLKAWLKSPHLGMLSILTAGDKHFFRHIETVKKQTGIDLNLWGVNPLEVTHFKSGFLGIPPDFEEKRVYSHGWSKQLRYQKNRFKAMIKSPGYFNESIWDTISGEYFRSFKSKSDYFHVFDYWRWDENLIDSTLASYSWETAPDTKTTWRIGDGTAAFYNYVYYTVAGFTEHDTFRSNQIREGQISRKRALELVMEENQPRYQNIKWYLDILDFDFKDTAKIINKIPKLYAY